MGGLPPVPRFPFRAQRRCLLNDADLLVTLAFALAAAGIGALGAALLRQSLVLGYIVAGMAIGPNTPGFVIDVPAVEQLADIGVVLLMFVIGIQLSFSDLRRVGGVAVVGGTLQVLVTIGVVYLIGIAVGFGRLEALFFGAVISNSSSTVLSKVLSERGELDSLHGRISLAWSTVQDFGTVALVVILTTLSEGSTGTLAVDLARALALAAAFLALVVPVGLFGLPLFFAAISRLQSSEVMTLTAAGVALGVAYLAEVFGISVALGAFVGGILVGRSDVSHEITGRLSPLRDLFSGLFFVSVGMLIDLDVVLENLWLVGLTVALIILFKGVVSGVITLGFGYRGRTAVVTGAILGQSAEFSFLLARLGIELDAISSDVFGLMLAGAAISIVLAPAVLGAVQPLGRAVERRLPLSPRSEIAEEVLPPLGFHGHAILAGYGRVGKVVHDVLSQQAIDVVIIEADAGRVSDLRAAGVPVLEGSTSNPVLLERAGLAEAKMLIVAIPDAAAARRIVEFARGMNPGIDIVVRTHSQAERRFLERHGVDEAVIGELELALEMSRHSLRRFGMADAPVELLLRKIRTATLEDG